MLILPNINRVSFNEILRYLGRLRLVPKLPGWINHDIGSCMPLLLTLYEDMYHIAWSLQRKSNQRQSIITTEREYDNRHSARLS